MARTIRKKPSVLKKLFSGNSAAIVAALIGGVFSLTSAIIPRVLPLDQLLHEQSGASDGPVPERLPSITAEPVDVSVATPISVPGPVSVLPEFKPEALGSSLACAEMESLRNRIGTETQVPARHRPNLTYGVWTIFAARDSRGTVWNNSTLKITSQQETNDGLHVAGYLDLRANGKVAGREFVEGHYVYDTRSLFIQGRPAKRCDRKLVLVGGSAQLSEDERRLTGGTWGSISGCRPVTPGRWEACR
jgi:hypothetical protein